MFLSLGPWGGSSEDRAALGRYGTDAWHNHESTANRVPALCHLVTLIKVDSRYGDAISPNGLTALVRNYIDQANIGKRGSCHLFRHTCATLMLEGGADVRFIQALLGHAKLETTGIYTQVSIKQLKDVHTLTHPAKINSKKDTENLPE